MNDIRNLRQAIGLQETGATGKAIAMRSPFLAVAGLAIDVGVGSVASDDRVQGLCAVPTLKALAMPFATFSQHLFCGKDDTAATRAALARGCLDSRSVDHCGSRSLVTVQINYKIF